MMVVTDKEKEYMIRWEKMHRMAASSFIHFIQCVHPSYQPEFFHKLIISRCQDLADGKCKKLMVFIPPQHGKAIEITTPVLTANRGWVKHGELVAGDLVFNQNGEQVVVQAVTPHYQWECREIEFQQGESIIASCNHEWGCYIPNSDHKAIFYPDIETDEIWDRKQSEPPFIKSPNGLHFIKSIKPAGKRMVNCIQVDGGYYLVGKELRCTHNSELISRLFPAWMMLRDPDIKIAGCSYSSDLSMQFSRAVQRVIISPQFQSLTSETKLNGVPTTQKAYKRNADYFEVINHTGFYKSVGVGGSLTGTPVDIAIIDDPVKDATEAYSLTYRQRVWDWYNTVLTTRLHNNSKQLFIMTRWHEDDLAGRILKAEPDEWEVLTIPAICEQDGDGGLHSPRHIGDALWPERHSLEKLMKQKARSPREFSALYQQHPTIEGGNIVKRDWFGRISFAEFKARRFREPMHFYLDTAYKKRQKGRDNDPSGILAACLMDGKVYIYHAQSAWLEMPDLLRFLPRYIQDHCGNKESILHIEPKANGLSVLQMLQSTTTLNVKATPVPEDDKEVRFRVVSPRIETGKVVLVDGDWCEDFLNEVCGFPAMPHDEMVDILGYAINDLLDEDDIDYDDYSNYRL